MNFLEKVNVALSKYNGKIIVNNDTLIFNNGLLELFVSIKIDGLKCFFTIGNNLKNNVIYSSEILGFENDLQNYLFQHHVSKLIRELYSIIDRGIVE